MDIENKKLNVGDAFKDNFYIIPDYQREYVWEEKQVNQLFEDITEEFQNKSDSEYFIGSIVVCNRGNREDKKFDVIDGQQRLTTLFLAMCVFKKMLKENKDIIDILKPKLFEKKQLTNGKIFASYKIILQYENTADIIQKAAEEKEIDGDLKGSAERLVNAYNYLTQYLLSNFKKKEQLNKFLAYLTNKVNLIQIETPSISDALKIFETINARGVGLNPMDLLKNLIFRQVSKEDFEKLKIEWKKIIDILEKNKEKPLRFLRYFIMANYKVKNAKGEEIVREDEIYDWITEKSNIKQCEYEEKPFEFVEEILKNVNSYVSFSKGFYKDGNRNIFLDNIKKLSGSFSQHLILLLAGKDLEEGHFNYLAKQVETLIFYYILTRTSTKELERKFSKWAKEIKEIATLKGEDQKNKLNKFIIDKIKPEISSKESSFENDFMNFGYFLLQQYRLRYVLGKIAQYVDLRALGQREFDFLDQYIKTKIEIEHILPNNPTEELKKSFEESLTDKGKEGGYDSFKVKVGNLTLLEKPINIVASRDFFEKKKPLYKKSNFLLTRSIASIEDIGKDSSINRINRQLMSFERWDKNSINDRQRMLFNLAKKIWSIDTLE